MVNIYIPYHGLLFSLFRCSVKKREPNFSSRAGFGRFFVETAFLFPAFWPCFFALRKQYLNKILLQKGLESMKKITRRSCLEKITPYVPGKPVEEVERELGISGVIKMASNENPMGPSPLALQAIEKHLHRLHFYPDGNCYYLKQELAPFLGVKSGNIVVGNGADELITLLGAAYLEPGDEILVGHPSFSEYDFSARLMEAEPRRVPLHEHRFDLKAMAKEINPRTRLVFLCNPNNPTGTTVTHAEVEGLLQELPPEVLLVMDEAYCEYVDEESYPRSLELAKERENVLVLRTFSKIYGLAGLRIGYGVGSEEIIKDLNTVREPFNVNALAQAAARAALEDREHFQAGFEANAEGKKFLQEEFERMALSYVPTQANFIFVDTGVDSRALFQELLQRGVIVRTGDIFGFPTFIRVTIGTREQNRYFIKCLEEVLKELSK